MTNLATVTNWPLIVTVVDIIWGVVITSASAISGYIFAKKFGDTSPKSESTHNIETMCWAGFENTIRLVES